MLRTRESLVVPLAAMTAIFWTHSAKAQLDLPPPPPPPLGQPNDVPSLPPPPAPPASESAPEPARRSSPPPSRGTHNRAPATAHSEGRPAAAAPLPEPARRAVAVTWNPLGIPWGRLSANVEVQLWPHHALAASLNSLVFHADRGSSRDLLSEGFGFASPTSFGFGGELGYHYWLQGRPSLSGLFVGPAFLFGVTTKANVGDATQAQGYWGLALDGGVQEIVVESLTVGGGAGIALIDMAGVTALVPRLLAQVGWSF